MFTQCPRCDAIFQLTASQLKAANGDVRCGQCLSVFSALNHLSEDLPSAQETEDLTHKTSQSEKASDNVTRRSEPSAGQTDADTESDSNDIFNDIISEVNGHHVPVEEIDRFEAFLATDTLPADDDPATNSFFPSKHSHASDDALPTENAQPADKTYTSKNETGFGDIDTVTAALGTDISIDDDEFAEFSEYLDTPDNKTRHNHEVEANDNKIIIEAADLESVISPNHSRTPDAVEISSQEETTDTPKEQSSPTKNPQSINIPDLILDDLHAAQAEQLRPSNAPWILGSLLLMFTLVSQVVYHSRDELAKDASLRPWLIQMCEILNCTVSQPYDIKQIDIIGRDVRSHPSADNALIVSTTLINTATFVQPFPLLTMVFSDINGTTIAQRRFTPREYLDDIADLNAGMTPNMPIRIDLELIDPGKTAVNYEFRAEIDPRQTRPLT